MENINSNFNKKVKAACNKKEDLFDSSILKYIFRSALAGIFLTLTTLAGLIAADHLSGLSPVMAKPAFAGIFAIGLCYVLFLNAELATGNMMFLTAGVYNKYISLKKAIFILLVCTFGNLIGAYLVSFVTSLTSAINAFDANSFLTSLVSAKLDKTSMDILFAGLLANVFVNLAVLSFVLIENQAFKGFLIMSAVFMFVYIGLEHVVANFGLFSLVQFSGNMKENFTLANVLRQWIFAFLGNYLGGGICIGLLYAWLNDTKSKFVD
ncbi:formate/nitrite transporter family protein [Anaerococcus hydrogenalis]|uniref:formate/nitrite transporter family protein n=1 Tax=Anaerococcus hydrogenalis TaxID=33029 RepID=UPI0023F50BC0|nr:formate/nitrite transporter family protein [Anaerococcus hydrogenalis]